MVLGIIKQTAEYDVGVVLIQKGSRLIEQSNRPVGIKDPGEGEPLLLPAGKGGGLGFGDRDKAHSLKDGRGFLFVFLSKRQKQIVQAIGILENQWVLGQ